MNTLLLRYKTIQLLLQKEIIAVFHIFMKYVNAHYGQKVELLNVKPGGTYGDNKTLKD